MKAPSSQLLPPDHAQRDLILDELDCNMIVEAAAGTGKTTSMVGRMVALLAKGKCKIKSLVAVTFTRKAAAELRLRFRSELEKQLSSVKDQELLRLRRAYQNIEQCYIGTIHSFCARLLKERPIEAGVDLSFVELDDEADYRLRSEAWTEFASSLFIDDKNNDGLLAGLSQMGLELDDLRNAFIRFCDFPDVDFWPFLEHAFEDIDLEELKAKLQAYLEHISSLQKSLPRDPGNDKLLAMYLQLPRIARHFDWEDPAQLIELLTFFTARKSVVQKNWPGKKEQALAEKERWDDFGADYAKPALDAWHQKRYPLVIEILKKAAIVYDRHRQAHGALNYQDLLIKAADLLEDKPYVRKYFQKRFTHILVDEFQDTDPIQAKVLLYLTADDVTQEDWQKCVPKAGSLFVVGDPKQSIYRFRRADIIIYNEVKKIITNSTGRIVQLSANFRTLSSILSWVNEIFGPAFPKKATAQSPEYVALKSGRPQEKIGYLSGVSLLEIPDLGTTRADVVVKYEADMIARTIRKALDSNLSVTRGGILSLATPADFMIVTARVKNLDVYADKLQEYGIDHQVTGGRTLGNLDQLKLLYLCLKALLEPHNPIALLSVLRSELFGISDADLYQFKVEGGTFNFKHDKPNSDVFKETFDKLVKYDSWLSRLAPMAAIERIIADLGLVASASIEAAGDVQVGCIYKTLELLRKKDKDSWSIRHLAEQLSRLITQLELHDGISIKSFDSSSVRIMNLHKVKGLEAPVVFLADPTGNSDFSAELHIDRLEKQVLGYMSISKKTGYHYETIALPKDWQEFQEKEQEFLAAEKLRLLYVAATRAGSQLIISQLTKSNQRNPWQMFAPHLKNAQILPNPGQQSALKVEPADFKLEEFVQKATDISSKINELAGPSYNVEGAKEYSMKDLNAYQAPKPAQDSKKGAQAAEWGSVIHDLLERAMKQEIFNEEFDLSEQAKRSLIEYELPQDRAEEAVCLVQKVKASDLWQRAKKSKQCLVEVPFKMMAQAQAEISTLITGAIDLVFEEQDGWVVVDYKTDKNNDINKIMENYKPQLESYANAFEKISGYKVKEWGLFLTQSNEYRPYLK
jgi:ATP-dependent helicase/nuclease subunit A